LETADFVRSVLLDEVRAMRQAGVRFHTLAAMAHGIEVCGALLDNRPFKAKGLGRSRFSLALTQLFPSEYAKANRTVDLYGQLRSHMSHSMVPGKMIVLSDDAAHLEFDGARLSISLMEFFIDYEKSLGQLLDRIGRGSMKEKIIGYP
jgi:hypothetical protein